MDLAMRLVDGGGAVMRQTAWASQMGCFETRAMTQATNLHALAALSGLGRGYAPEALR
jgi:hypothetical protein